jgi:FixJ family two-component response regulator
VSCAAAPGPSPGMRPKATIARTKGPWYLADSPATLRVENGVGVTPHGEGGLLSQRQPIVALVEDDASMQRALVRVVSTAGWQAVPFPSAEALLQTGTQAAPDCLVCDGWLPDMTGVEFLEHFLATGSTLPVVIITGREDLQRRLRAIQAGAVASLRKPVDGSELLHAVQQGLDGRHRSERA